MYCVRLYFYIPITYLLETPTISFARKLNHKDVKIEKINLRLFMSKTNVDQFN